MCWSLSAVLAIVVLSLLLFPSHRLKEHDVFVCLAALQILRHHSIVRAQTDWLSEHNLRGSGSI